MPTTLYENRPAAGLAWSRCKNSRFFAIIWARATLLRGSAVGEGVKNSIFIAIFVWARATLCGDRRGASGAKNSRFFYDFVLARATLCADRRKNSRFFWDFCGTPPRGPAWSRCKNSRVFCDFLRCSRDPLR